MRIATRVIATAAIPATLLFALAACSSGSAGNANAPSAAGAPTATDTDTDTDTDTVAPVAAATPSAAEDAAVAKGSSTNGSTRGVTVNGNVVTADVSVVGAADGDSKEPTPIHVHPGQTLRLIVDLSAWTSTGYTADCIAGHCPKFLGKGTITVNGTTEVAEYRVTGTGKDTMGLIFDNRHDADQPNQPYDAAWVEVSLVSDK